MKILAKLIYLILFAFILSSVLFSELQPSAYGQSSKRTIAIVQDGTSSILDKQKIRIKKELSVLTDEDFDITFAEPLSFNCNWNLSSISKVLEKALEDPSIDMILAIGPLTTATAAGMDMEISKPIIAGGLYEDVKTLNLSYDKDGLSTIKNFTFVTIPFEVHDDINVFKTIVPFKNVLVLVDSVFMAGEKTEINKTVSTIEEKSGVSVNIQTMNTDADEVLEKISKQVEAIYITPAMRMDIEEFQKLIDGINGMKIPTFSMMGRLDVDKGVLAGQMPDMEERHARRAALNIQQVLMGTSPNDLSVFIPIDKKLVINGKTAQLIGYEPSFSTMMNSTVLFREDLEKGKSLSLQKAVGIALKNNIELSISEAEEESAKQTKNKAFSLILPQVNGNARYSQIDTDRAESSFGMQPEELGTAGISLSQMIFSDSVISQFKATGQSYIAAQLEKETKRLDIIEKASKSFLQYLLSKALLKIEIDNLKLTDKNLDLARLRLKVGTSGPEEVYRWEAEQARQKSSVIDAEATVKKAQVALNQILGEDQATQWLPQDIAIQNDEYYFLEGHLADMVTGQKKLDLFQSVLVKTAISNSPEITALEHLIAAQDILLGFSKRRFLLPDVYAGFTYDYQLHEKIVGPALPDPLFQGADSDKNEWLFSVSATLPLFEGGGRIHEVARNKAELTKLIDQKTQANQLVEQRLRTAFFAVSSSWPNIKLSRQAAESALKNLNIVQDKYSQGTVSILDLLDAQNQSFTRKQAAIISVYKYLEDVFELQRSISWFEIDKTQEEKDVFIKDLKNATESSLLNRE